MSCYCADDNAFPGRDIGLCSSEGSGWTVCPSNTPAFSYTSASETVYLCCQTGDQCGAEGICYNATRGALYANDQDTRSGFYKGACTDSTYDSPICNQGCPNTGNQDIDWDLGTGLWQCCESEGTFTNSNCSVLEADPYAFQGNYAPAEFPGDVQKPFSALSKTSAPASTQIAPGFGPTSTSSNTNFFSPVATTSSSSRQTSPRRSLFPPSSSFSSQTDSTSDYPTTSGPSTTSTGPPFPTQPRATTFTGGVQGDGQTDYTNHSQAGKFIGIALGIFGGLIFFGVLGWTLLRSRQRRKQAQARDAASADGAEKGAPNEAPAPEMAETQAVEQEQQQGEAPIVPVVESGDKIEGPFAREDDIAQASELEPPAEMSEKAKGKRPMPSNEMDDAGEDIFATGINSATGREIGESKGSVEQQGTGSRGSDNAYGFYAPRG